METEITITLTVEEHETLSKCVDAKVEYYARTVERSKRNRKFNAKGLWNRRLITYTSLQKKFA